MGFLSFARGHSGFCQWVQWVPLLGCVEVGSCQWVASSACSWALVGMRSLQVPGNLIQRCLLYRGARLSPSMSLDRYMLVAYSLQAMLRRDMLPAKQPLSPGRKTQVRLKEGMQTSVWEMQVGHQPRNVTPDPALAQPGQSAGQALVRGRLQALPAWCCAGVSGGAAGAAGAAPPTRCGRAAAAAAACCCICSCCSSVPCGTCAQKGVSGRPERAATAGRPGAAARCAWRA